MKKIIIGGILGVIIGILGLVFFWDTVSSILHSDFFPTWSEEWYVFLISTIPPIITGFITFANSIFGSDYFFSILKIIGTSFLSNIISFAIAIIVGLIIQLINGGPLYCVFFVIIAGLISSGSSYLIIIFTNS